MENNYLPCYCFLQNHQKGKDANHPMEKDEISSKEDSPQEAKENNVSFMFERCCAAANAYLLTIYFLKTAET